MPNSTMHIVFLVALFSLANAAFSFKPCSKDFVDLVHNFTKIDVGSNNGTKCKKLPTLQAQFAWNYHAFGPNETRIDVLIGTKMIHDGGWLAWGVNPYVPQMVGTSAIIAINNQSLPVVKTYNITKYTKSQCGLLPSDAVDVRVLDKRVELNAETGFFAMFATLILDRKYNISRFNHVWQVGYLADGLEPKMHGTSLQNVDSKEILDLKTGNCQDIGHNRRHLRKIHGILNITGWGTLLPIGVIIARYFREFPVKLEPWWYRFHYSCQAIGYILGTVGWGLGLLLGHESKYYSFHTHRVLGVSIFGFSTLQVTQMLAFRLKPGREDEYRKHWNVYHHFLGYALLVMIPVNIYQGIKILKPDNKRWKQTYTGILVLLAIFVLALEIFTWAKFLYKKMEKRGEKTTEKADKELINSSQRNPVQGPST